MSIYTWAANNRIVRKSLNIFGAIASGITPRYVPGRTRLAHVIAERQYSRLEMLGNGISADGQLLADSSFLAENFLARGITSLQFNTPPSANKFLAFSRSKKITSTEQIAGNVDATKAAEIYKSVAYTNFKHLIKVNSLGSIAANFAYLTFILSSAFNSHINTFADYFFSAGMILGSSLLGLINIFKQYTNLRGTKYQSPEITLEAQQQVAGPNGPKVTLLVPVLGEPKEVVKTTLQVALQQNYAQKEIVLLIDDKPDTQSYDDMLAVVREVNANLPSEAQPVKYFARMKYANVLNQQLNKADNINAFLQYACGKTITESETAGQVVVTETDDPLKTDSRHFQRPEYIAIADADQQFSPDFLSLTVAAINRDPSLAVVQTSQDLTPKGSGLAERIGAQTMNAFWQIYQRGADVNNGIYFGGTNGVVRLAALESVKRIDSAGRCEYFPTGNVTEDFCLSLLFIKNHWRLKLLAQVLSRGLPASNLADHMVQYWRYVEGPIEATIEYTLPMMFRSRAFAFSHQAFEYFMKGVQPFYGWSLAFFQFIPLASVLGISLPEVSPTAFAAFWGSMLLFNSNVVNVYLRNVDGKPFDQFRTSALMFLHFPVFCHATVSAIRAQITGQKPGFVKTPKDGARSRIPLRYSAPLVSFASLNAASLALCIVKYCTGGESWLLQSAFWASVNLGLISYGLVAFNGVKNTFSDLYSETKKLFTS